MTAVTATEAKNRLGQVLEQAQRAPVFIEKAGRRHSVVLSVEHYEALLSAAQAELRITSSKQFYERYRDWVDEMNRLVDDHGVFGEDVRPW